MDLKQWLRNRLFIIKIWKRNYKAKPVRRQQAAEGIRALQEASGDPKRIFFCCIPTHRNLGDQCQRYCIEAWCRENYPEYRVVPLPTWGFYERDFRRALEAAAGPEDLFVIQSGYCTTSRHFDHPVHRWIVSRFTGNGILIMPQTVRFNEDRDGTRTGRIYDAHPRLLFLARDKVSFESAKKYFPGTRVELFPDIVTTLIGTRAFNEARDGVLLCVRNDAEKALGNDKIEALQNRIEKAGYACEVMDTNSDLSLDELVKRFPEELEKTLRRFASRRVVITDRYHGTIFSMIANTPVIVLPTKDHKVKTGTEWFKGVYDDAYRNASDTDEAFDMAMEALRSERTVTNESWFKKNYYDRLKGIFEEGK